MKLSDDILNYITWATKNITVIHDVTIITSQLYEKAGILACLEYHRRLSANRQLEVEKTMLHYWHHDHFQGMDDVLETLPKEIVNAVLSYDIQNTYPDKWYQPLKDREPLHLWRYEQRGIDHQQECVRYIPPFHPLFLPSEIKAWNQILAQNVKKQDIGLLVHNIKNTDNFWQTVEPEHIRACVKYRTRHKMALPLEELLLTILNNRPDLQDIYYDEILASIEPRWHPLSSIFHAHPLIDDIFQRVNETKIQTYESPSIKDVARIFKLVGTKLETLTSLYIKQNDDEYGTLLEFLHAVYQTNGIDHHYWAQFFDNPRFHYPNLPLLSFLYDIQRYEIYNVLTKEPLSEHFQLQIKKCEYGTLIQKLESRLEFFHIKKQHFESYLLNMEELVYKNYLKEIDILQIYDILRNNNRLDVHINNLFFSHDNAPNFLAHYHPFEYTDELSVML